MPQASSYNVTDIFIEAGLKTADKILTIAQKGCASLSDTLDLTPAYSWPQQAYLNRNLSMETLS